MMSNKIVRNKIDLKRRINHFLKSPHNNRFEVKDFIDDFKMIGDLAIFGGAVRDIGMKTNCIHPNDVDLVIQTDRQDFFLRRLSKYNVSKNKFGGYRVHLRSWKVDIWEFKNTWAFINGHVRGDDFCDLVKTTFFDWDAVVYDLYNDNIYTIPDYIERVHSGIVDLNLKPNPNSKGIVSRAFRYLEKENAKLSPELALYIGELIDTELHVNANKPRRKIINDLRQYILSCKEEPFSLKSKQLALF